MANERPGFFARIKRFVKGNAKDTPMNTERMNEIVNLLNALLASKGTNGIRVVPAMAGFTFELDDTAKKQLGMLPIVGADGAVEEPPAMLHWRGVWSSTANYAIDDVVIRTYDGELGVEPTVAGTFICIQDAPAGTPGPTETASTGVADTFWDTVARSSFETLTIKGKAYADGGSGYNMVLDASFIPIRITIPMAGVEKRSLDITPTAIQFYDQNNITKWFTGFDPVGTGDSFLVMFNSLSTITLSCAALNGLPVAARFVELQPITFKNSSGSDETRMFLCGPAL